MKQCWRKGAYLRHGTAQARLELYDGVDRKYLDVRILGDVSRDRRELLNVVREHVRKINSRFHRIVITEEVPCRCSPGCPHQFAYQDLRHAEDLGRTEVDCPKSWQRVSIQKLLDGVEPMPQESTEDSAFEKMRNMRNMRIDARGATIYTGDITGDHPAFQGTRNAVPVHAAEEAENAQKPPEKDKASIKLDKRAKRAETLEKIANALLKFLLAVIVLGVIAASAYGLLTGKIDLMGWLKPFLGNIPG